jgi:hypothetical protein
MLQNLDRATLLQRATLAQTLSKTHATDDMVRACEELIA